MSIEADMKSSLDAQKDRHIPMGKEFFLNFPTKFVIY